MVPIETSYGERGADKRFRCDAYSCEKRKLRLQKTDAVSTLSREYTYVYLTHSILIQNGIFNILKHLEIFSIIFSKNSSSILYDVKKII